MAKIVIQIDDTNEGDVAVKFTSDTELPDKFEDYTLAQIMAGQLHDLIGKLFEEQPSN